MLLIPAIDLKEGHCVRLRQGRMEDNTVFSEDPIAIAKQWVDAGAKRLHIVDLDGAFAGKPVNAGVIHEICSSFPELDVQIGGGDLPSGIGGAKQLIHANELVALIRDNFGEHFEINVGAYPEIHPEAESYSKDIYWLGEKFRAGADRAITQYFYNADAYFRFVDECAKVGINKPIVPGIMPLTNYHNLVRFSDNCGAEIPRWLRWQLKERSDNPEDLVRYGLDVVTKLCETLVAGGAPGLHFYTMNQWQNSDTLCRNLGLATK